MWNLHACLRGCRVQLAKNLVVSQQKKKKISTELQRELKLHIYYSTHFITVHILLQYTFITVHIYYSTHFIKVHILLQYTFYYSTHLLQYTFITVHIYYSTHLLQYTFYYSTH